MENKKSVIILIGPIGSGKDTQADILEEKLHLFRLKTSQLLEDKFNKTRQIDSEYENLQKEKALWAGGILNTPEWVLSVVKEKVKEIASQDQGVIFSGSPRTLFEAEGLIPFLEELYGKENIKIINLKLDEHQSIERNSARRVCEQNLHPIPNFPEYQNMTKCPIDNSKLVTRELDKPETIRIRYQEYLNRTFPILDFLKTRGYKIEEINGDQPIQKVFEDISDKFK